MLLKSIHLLILPQIVFIKQNISTSAQSAGAVKYTDCISAEG